MTHHSRPSLSEVTPALAVSLVRLIQSLTVTDKDLCAAERCVRDWLGSLAAGAGTEPGLMLRSYGRGVSDLEGRVFLAAALSHITETDDLHRGSITHPGCVVIPTALLLGRQRAMTGRPVLEAVLAGYEAMLRIGEALGPGHYEVFHNTATAGVFGSAAAAASILGLEEEQWVGALGNAGTQAAGLWQFNEDATMSKHLHAGHAAAAGLRAALLAREGFTGPAAILEGKKGFFKGFCPDARPKAVLAEAPGWKLRETSLKPYPSCRHTHPAIDAALALRDRVCAIPDFPDGLTSVSISSYADALRLTDNPSPQSPYAAKFSLQFCVATALTSGVPGLSAFTEASVSDPALRRIMDRTTVTPGQEWTAAYPERWGASVEVVGGVTAERHYAERTTPKGDPEHPLADEEIDTKVRELAGYGGVDKERTEELLCHSKALSKDGPLFELPNL